MYKRWWLYILKLEHDRWYVGITSKTPEQRFREHQLGTRGAYWTKAHKPLEIEKFEDLGVVSREHAEKYENEVTRLLIKERGLNNVRGGDLRHNTEYVQRFGWIFFESDWRAFTIMVFQQLIIFVLIVALVIK